MSPAVRLRIRAGCGVPLLLALHVGGCSSAPTRPASVERGDYAKVVEYASALIRHEMRKGDVIGLSIALVDDQRVVWAEGFGYADKAGKVPASPETAYRAGSISKLFTAAAAMQLADRGRLDIDRPLKDHLPEFSIRTRFADTAPVTPRLIMTHHSGLPADYLKGMWTRNPEPFNRIVDRVRDEYAAYPPGAMFSYSNLGVTLLMVFAEGNAGGRQILKPGTLADMLRPQNAEIPLDLDIRVGLAWMLSGLGNIDIRNGGPVAHHAGATLLFHGQLVILPERKLGVVVLANSDTAGKVVGKVATETLKLALEAKTGDRQPEREKPEGGESPLSPQVVQRYEGWYATPAGAVNVRKVSRGLR